MICGARRCGVGLVALFCLGLSVEASAAGGRFKDARGRFALTLPHGWTLAPMPGDTHGMVFQRRIGDVPALLRVYVEKARDDDTLSTALDRRSRAFTQEIGYRRMTDLDVKLAGLPALRRTHSVYVSGDARLVRYAVDTVLLAYGYVHFVHFETEQKAYTDFKRDLDRLLASYKVLAGRAVYAPLIGSWQLVGSREGLMLVLQPSLRFRLDKQRGTYRADRRQLSLITSGGRETFTYQVSASSLVVNNANLGGPMTYRRAGGGQPDLVAPEPKVARARGLVGRWKVEGGSTQLILTPSGSVQFGPLSGHYRRRGSLLTITSTAGTEVTYHTSLRAGRLTLSGGDLERPLRLLRVDE